MHRKYFHQGLRIIDVTALTAPLAEIRAFLRERGITYAAAIDPEGKVHRRYGVRRFPATVLIDRAGVVRFIHDGFRRGDEEAIEAAIRAALELSTRAARPEPVRGL